MPDSDELDDVLAQTAWLRRLARRLVADEAERDDLVQQAWLEVLRARSRPRAARAWMFGVLRNLVRMRLRGEERRLRRESGESLVTTPPAHPEELVERVEVERRVASELLQIDEPYRSTLLMRYYDELEPKEIAQRLGIPASTVRGRLKEGLDRLRVRLDREFGDDRRRWGLALIPTAAVAHGREHTIAATIGAALATKTMATLVAGALGVALLSWGAARRWRAPAGSTELARMTPGTPWRGALGHRGAVDDAATLAGARVPRWFGQPGAPVRRIAGRVTVGGAPLAGATVELVSALSDAGVLPLPTQRSAGDGSFDFGSQPPARYFIAASARQHSPALVELDTRDVTAAADRVELRIGGCASALFGHVDDASGGPVVGARVCWAPPRATCVVTDENGAYEMCLSPRQTAVEIAAKGYGAYDERVLPSGRRTKRDFLLTPEATAIGRVVRAEDGRALAGALVELVGIGQNTARWAASAATVSDADGRFTVSGLPPGRVRLSGVSDGAAAEEWLELNAEAGRVTGEILLRLGVAAVVSGTVTDGRDPVRGAVVAVGEPGALRSDAVTQSDGSFVLPSVPRGTERLRVAGYEVREPSALGVDRNRLADVHVVVAPMGSIAGQVTRAGRPLGGAKVGYGFNVATWAGDDGRYVLRGLPPANYRLYADSPLGDAFGIADVTLGAGEARAGVDIEVQWGGTISGTIVESSGAPAANVWVRFEAQHLADGGEDVTAPDGSFRVATLIGGDDYRPYVRPSRCSNQKLVAGDEDFPNVHVADGASHVTGVRLVIKRAHLPIAGSVVDGQGQPLADVHVAASRVDGDEPGANVWFDAPSTISGADGSFRIDDLDAGLYRLEARSGDGGEATIAAVAAG
ncbi:MAG TPA: sigma-70 family RNA polymerase sigma factor, partial [Polyangia bacterium]